MDPAQSRLLDLCQRTGEPLTSLLDQAGVTPEQLDLWLKHPRFRRALQRAARHAQRQSLLELQYLTGWSIRTLSLLAQPPSDPDPASKPASSAGEGKEWSRLLQLARLGLARHTRLPGPQSLPQKLPDIDPAAYAQLETQRPRLLQQS